MAKGTNNQKSAERLFDLHTSLNEDNERRQYETERREEKERANMDYSHQVEIERAKRKVSAAKVRHRQAFQGQVAAYKEMQRHDMYSNGHFKAEEEFSKWSEKVAQAKADLENEERILKAMVARWS